MVEKEKNVGEGEEKEQRRSAVVVKSGEESDKLRERGGCYQAEARWRRWPWGRWVARRLGAAHQARATQEEPSGPGGPDKQYHFIPSHPGIIGLGNGGGRAPWCWVVPHLWVVVSRRPGRVQGDTVSCCYRWSIFVLTGTGGMTSENKTKVAVGEKIKWVDRHYDTSTASGQVMLNQQKFIILRSSKLNSWHVD